MEAAAEELAQKPPIATPSIGHSAEVDITKARTTTMSVRMVLAAVT